MKTTQWLNGLMEEGLVCERYKSKVSGALSKKQLMDTFLDANGIPFLCEMDNSGHPLPYEVILSEFKSYVNGRYVSSHGESGKEYTSSFYCCYSEGTSVEITTTQTLFLGCSLDVYIRENDYVRIYLDKGSDVRIHCPNSARCIVERWGNAKVSVYGAVGNVRISDMDKDVKG